jgi:hypothetical protein
MPRGSEADGFLCKALPKAVFRFAKGEEENNPVPWPSANSKLQIPNSNEVDGLAR